MGLHKKLEDITRDICLASDDEPDTSKVHKAFDKAAKKVYKKQKFTPDMLKDKDINNLIDELYNVLSGAVTYGTSKAEHPELLEELLSATYNFSGFKTYHQMNEVGFLLTETKSNIPSYEEFKAQSKGIDDKYNELYLKTEYQLFADSSRMASKWAEIEEDGDRYDLQYRTAHDDKVREEHRALEGTTLPPSDPFWDSYYPPNGYNCRCTVEQVRKGKYPRSNSAAAIDLGNSMTEGKKSIFRFNPGKVKSPYPKKHPYMPTGCGDCDKGLKMAFNPNAEKCKACVAISECKDDYSFVDGTNNLVRIHKNHGKNEKVENIIIAKYLSNKYGYKIDLLPVPQQEGFKGADTYNHTLGYNQEYKTIKTATYNAIDKAIQKGSKQANNIVLSFNSEINMELITNVLNDRIKRCHKLKTITLIINNKAKIYTCDEITKEDFKSQQEDFE